jgi:hypothetical protein
MGGYCTEKQRTPISGGKLVGVLVCGRKDMSPDLACASAKWNPRKNRLPKMSQDAFLWVSAIMTFGNPAATARSKLVRRRAVKQKPHRPLTIDEVGLC